MATSVYAVKSTSGAAGQTGRNRFIRSLLVMSLLSIGFVPTTDGATQSDLQAQIAELTKAVNAELIQDVDVLNALAVVTAMPQSLTVGVVSGTQGTAVNLPVYLKEGTKQVAGVQFDLTIPAGITVASVTPGIAAQAANKSAQGNPVGSNYRILVFGLNQTAISSGPVAIVRLNINPIAALGKRAISILNLSGTDPTGSAVSITGKNGSLEVR